MYNKTPREILRDPNPPFGWGGGHVPGSIPNNESGLSPQEVERLKAMGYVGVCRDTPLPEEEPTDEEVLEKAGWVLECQSPLEVSLKDDPTSRATGEAAEIVLEALRETH